MLKLSRKADYGLISLKHMAMKRSSASAREIAEAYGIPLPCWPRFLQKLARTGFLQSENGANGGYRLRRRAERDHRAGSDPHDRRSGFSDVLFHRDSRSCGVSDRCNVREPLRKVHDGIQSLLAGITIADMCDEEEELTPACAPPQADALRRS